MVSVTNVPRIRRTYNKWVANETLEDYALRFTAYKVRRFSEWRVANTAIGAVSFLALEAIGGAITLNYGFSNAVTAILMAGFIIFMMGIPIAYYSAKFGVDIDLLTRGAGFGYIGSTITSLIYASFTFIFFAIEAAIIASALELCFGIPLTIGYFISALVVIPLVTHGISFISRFQTWSQPIWIVLQIAPFIFLAVNSYPDIKEWTGYTGLLGPIDGTFNIAYFGAASAVLFSLVAQIGEQVDYLRFLPRETHRNRFKWWSALLCAGPGWIVIGTLKILAGSFLAFYAFRSGISFTQASEPTRMYLVVFEEMLSSPDFALAVTGIFVIICQLKINVTNTYAGSIAWSNFFSRLTHSHPGRVVWVVFNVIIGLLLMEFGVYKALEKILGLYSILAVAWLATIVADLAINKPLGLSPKTIEFKRAHLYDINPVGFGSMLIAVCLAFSAYFEFFGETAASLYSYVALLAPFLLVPALAILTKSKYYLARESSFAGDFGTADSSAIKCCVCEHSFDHEDMAGCPVYKGQICSLCCSLDTSCHDKCKTNARIAEQFRVFADAWLPPIAADWVRTRFARYLVFLTLINGLIGLVFWLFYFESTIDASIPSDVLGVTLTKLFSITFIISGIVVWLFVLAQESRRFAEEETSRKTELLVDEITAHEETDRQLKQAKEHAESANLAKSKYVVGLSHELRTPLNAILGYAQLMERRSGKAEDIRKAAGTIKRSGEHLASMIEGLLDISRIETGRLDIYRQKTALRPFLDQIVDMFALQAKAKNIAFEFDALTPLPDHVYTDEKRLRQVLINLLSNAIKFTDAGRVEFSIMYRNQIATVKIKDTGVGISDDEIERIFLPFERGNRETATPQIGTGLGLTITKLLVEIMGGELVVESDHNGTCFTIRMLLSSAEAPDENAKHVRSIIGYEGDRRTICVVDDDPQQRKLIADILIPLGFAVVEASNGHECLEILKHTHADIVILDVSMPGISGWETARRLKASAQNNIPILMLSADAGNERNSAENQMLYDGYLIKPLSLEDLYGHLSTLIPVAWVRREVEQVETLPARPFRASELPDAQQLKQLYALGQTGFLRSIEAMLDDLKLTNPKTNRFCEHLRALAKTNQFNDFLHAIDEVRDDAI